MIREATRDDAEAVARIYNDYVLNSIVTFEEKDVSDGEIARRIEKVQSAGLAYLVMEKGGVVCGFSYAAPWKDRSAYRFAVESSIYLDKAYIGRGLGTLLYQSLVERLPGLGVHAVLAGVALPNPASIALHKKLGFVEVALLREVGWKFKRWIDMTYWELLVGADT